MDSSSRALPFHIDLNEAPLPSPRGATERAPFLVEYSEPGRVKIEPGQRNVRVCSSCQLGSGSRRVQQQDEWKCFKCLLGNRGGGSSGSSGGGGGGVVMLDMNASPPREPEGERLFVDLNEDLAIVEQNHGVAAKVQARKSSSFAGHSFNAPTSAFLVYKENGFNFQRAYQFRGDIHKSPMEDPLHRPLSGQINSSIIDTAMLFDSMLRPCQLTPKKWVSQNASGVYLQGLRDYIAGMNGSLGDGWHVEFKYCDKRCKTYAVYVGPDGIHFESLEDVARHLGLHHSMEVESGGNGFTSAYEGLPNFLRSHEASGSSKARKSGQSRSYPGSSFFYNGASIFNCIYPNDGFPVQFEDFYLISAGNIDPRPSYHSTSEIWPVGYLSSWHDRITGSIFVCEVADGGDPGPVFKVRRYPCNLQAIPIGSTVLLASKCNSLIEEDNMENDNSATSDLIEEDSTCIQAMLAECTPPDLNDDSHTTENQDTDFAPRVNSTPEKIGNICPGVIGQGDSVGEFVVEGRSASSVWEMVTQTLFHACIDAYKQKGVFQFCCTHDICKMDEKEPCEVGSLSKFSYLGGPFNFPRLVQSNFEFKMACEMLMKWLERDRFGLDVDFVQEIIEQLPGVSACSNYKILTKRKNNTTLETVRSGFLQAKRKNRILNEREGVESFRKHPADSDIRGPCPSGKAVSTKIPTCLIGDSLQVWEFWLRFSEVLGMETPFAFEEIEEELVSPWMDRTSSMELPGLEIQDVREITLARVVMDSLPGTVGSHPCSQCTGPLLAKIHGLLLRALVAEMLSKVAVYVDPNFGAGGSKPRRGRKKDADNSATPKKKWLDMLPINEITWPEIARRYMLSLLSMEVNLESAEIACRESGKVFHCLQGDGGTLCGSLTGVAALEADAMLLAEATKQIFGSLKNGNILITIDKKESDAKVAGADDGEVPEWAKVLEPVRKLPTNVGARIRKCINEALERDPPEWARKLLLHSISKEVYKGNASGPTKRAVISVLADVNRENSSPKPEKEEKIKKSTSSVSDLIMKQCRIILRRAVKEDKDKVFCNLLGRAVLSPNDNDDEGLLGHPAMVSRPLDFRTIDLKLAAGSYGGSHESFIDDVHEVWHNIRTAYCNNSDLLELAGSLLQKFEEDYENEVLSLVQKIECSNDCNLSSEDAKARDDLLALVNESVLPKAPWEEGLCKVCGMDKDDVNVLLCDGCDSEYHTYCLDPPLVKVPDGAWYCPPCEAKASKSRNASSGTRIFFQRVRRRLHRNLTFKYMEALSQLTRTMELKEYWELILEDRIFLLKFLCDVVLNSSILRDHIDQSASLSAELQQKLRSLTAELKLLKCREEILTASLAKLKGNARNSGETGSDALASLRPNECKLKVQEPDSSSHNSSISGGFRQMDDGTKHNGSNDYSKQSCLYTSKSVQDKTCASGSNQIKNSPDLINHFQHQQSLKDNTVSQNASSHAKCTKEASLQDDLSISSHQQENDQIPGNCLESAQSSSNGLVSSAAPCVSGNTLSGSINNHMVERTPTVKYSRQGSIQADADLAQSYFLEISSLKNEIRALEDSIAAKELELQKVTVRKEYLGQDHEGRLYWSFGRSGYSLLVANASTSTQPESSRHLWSYGMESSRRSGVLDLSAPWENMDMPNLDQWTSYQSDAEIDELLGWLREHDTREKELKESILQWRSNKTKESSNSESHIHNKLRRSTSIPSDDSACFNSDSLITRAATAIKKKISGCLPEEEINICKDIGVKVRVCCDGGIYRCKCLEPLWSSRLHCLSCHQTFSTAEERVKHNDKCKIDTPIQMSEETIEQPTKRKRTMQNQTLQDNSLNSIDISQTSKNKKSSNHEASRRDNHDNVPVFADIQTKDECPFKLEEIKGKFIIQRSLRDLVNDIGLIGCNGTPSFVPCTSPYLSDPALGLVSERVDEVSAGKSTDLLSSEQESRTGANVSRASIRNISDYPTCIGNGFAEVGPIFERLKSATKRGRDQFSSTKDKVFDLGDNKYFIVPESTLHPLVGRASEILRCLKINLLDIDAALPEEALRVSRSQSERRCAWRAFVKSATTIYEMVLATITLEDTIKTEYLRNEWWYWSSPSTAATISTLSALALRVYALDSAVLYEKLSCQDASVTDCKEKEPSNSVPTNTDSPSRQKLPDSEPAENSRTKTRSSKRRKDSGG